MKLESESRFKYVIILQENLQVLLSPQLLMATGCFTLEVIVDYMIALTQTAWAALWRCKWTGTPAGGGACYYCRDFGDDVEQCSDL